MSLRNNIITSIKNTLIKIANMNNNITYIDSIQKDINTALIEKDYIKPILKPDYLKRLNNNSNETMDAHNNNVAALMNDSRILHDTVVELWNKLDIIDIIHESNIKIVNNMYNIIKRKIKELRRNYMLNANTIIENFSDIKNIDKLIGASINTEKNIATLKIPGISDDIITMEDADISVEINKNIPFVTPYNIKQILLQNNTTPIKFRAISNSREKITITVNITFKERNLSNISINTINNNLVYMDVYGNDTILIKKEGLTKGYYSYNIPSSKYNRIRFDFTMDMESYKSENGYIYDLLILNIALRNIKYNTHGEIISKNIEFGNTITDIALKATDLSPIGTNINYYVSKDDGKTWIKIEPIRSIYDKPIWYPICNKSEISFTINIDKPLLPDLSVTGNNEVYNILENVENENVENGKIKVPEGWEIDKSKSKIHYGINDYQIINDYIEYNKVGSLTEYIFDKEDNSWHDVYITIKDEPHISNSASFTLNYIPSDNNIIITDKTKIYNEYTINGNIVTINEGIADGTQLYVDYNTYIKTIEESDNVNIIINKSNIKIFNNPNSKEELNVDDVIDIKYEEKKIRLLPNADVLLDKTESKYVIYITFDYKAKTKNKVKQYKTYVLYKQKTTIDILPFTDEEISLGNKHIIDGNNVSKYTQYTLTSGWHTIITTQPFPSNPDPSINDVNSITNKRSNAGIILRHYSKMVAYKNDMNYVDLNKLTNIILPSDNRSFSIHNNKIYINFMPDNPTINNNGIKLLCRSVKWDDKVVSEYIMNEPKFDINIILKPGKDSEESVNKFRYKIELDREVGKSSPIVYKLEWFAI